MDSDIQLSDHRGLTASIVFNYENVYIILCFCLTILVPDDGPFLLSCC